MSFEKAFKSLPEDAQNQVQEIAAFAVLQTHLKDPATKPSMENVELVSYALAIRYEGNHNQIASDYQSVMNSRFAMEQQQNDKTLSA